PLVGVKRREHLPGVATGAAEDREPELGVGLHDTPLWLGERARLLQDRSRDPELADVVQQATAADGVQLLPAHAQLTADIDGEPCDPAVVALVAEMLSGLLKRPHALTPLARLLAAPVFTPPNEHGSRRGR